MAEKTCGVCRYITKHPNECHVNPPVIIEALVIRTLKAKTYDDIIAAASFRPSVEQDDPACRFFERGVPDHG